MKKFKGILCRYEGAIETLLAIIMIGAMILLMEYMFMVGMSELGWTI